MSWPSNDDGWLLADTGDGTRELLSTHDAGASWASSGLDVDGAMQVIFADSANGWLVGVNGLRSTHDDGSTWNSTSIPGGISTDAAVATSEGVVHTAYLAGDPTMLHIATSPVDHDAFVVAPVSIQAGAGPRLDVSMTAGGPYGAMIYNDRTFVDAAEIRNGQWTPWKLDCPYPYPSLLVGLSPHGQALAVACGPSGFADDGPIVAADLSSGSIVWTTVEPAGNGVEGQNHLGFATATDAGVRIVAYSKGDGTSVIASSTDGGATWPTRTTLPAETLLGIIAHLPDGRVLITTDPGHGLISPDGLTWTSVATSPS
ncbi:MAG: hypothetical protein ABIR32_01095 [Ilumatobacteraceae bacterium]